MVTPLQVAAAMTAYDQAIGPKLSMVGPLFRDRFLAMQAALEAVQPHVTGEQVYMARYGADGGRWECVEERARYLWDEQAEAINKILRSAK